MGGDIIAAACTHIRATERRCLDKARFPSAWFAFHDGERLAWKRHAKLDVARALGELVVKRDLVSPTSSTKAMPSRCPQRAAIGYGDRSLQSAFRNLLVLKHQSIDLGFEIK